MQRNARRDAPASREVDGAGSASGLGGFARLARRAVLRALRQLTSGELTVVDSVERVVLGGVEPGPAVTVRIRHPRFYTAVALSGALGAAESYMRGDWSADDLPAVIRLMLRNGAVSNRLEGPIARLRARAMHRWQRLHTATNRGIRRYIAAHYDLGNDFFELVLDPSLSYSCALFEREGMSLEEAATAKLERVCRKLRLAPTDHLLEIGSGWGALAFYAARRFGCRVTTLTLSRQQYDFVVRRAQRDGLADRVTVLLDDYRNAGGRYDKLVSVEMIEALDPATYPTFFRQCARLLKADGMMLLQAIVVDDRVYERSRRSVDFIKRYIFPGGCVPSVGALCAAALGGTDLRLVHLEDLTPHYATTLRAWRARLLANAARVRALGFSDTFIRMWEFYFCYCEGGFEERHTGDVQMLFTKPQCRAAPLLPTTALL